MNPLVSLWRWSWEGQPKSTRTGITGLVVTVIPGLVLTVIMVLLVLAIANGTGA